MSMKSQITEVCSLVALSRRRLGNLLNTWTKSFEKLFHAFISSKLDHCNSLFLGLPDRELNRLQRIQSPAARLVSGTRKYVHITPVLKSSHCLPVKARIHFKVILLRIKPYMFIVLNTSATYSHPAKIHINLDLLLILF